MDYFFALLSGAVQGATEFLPISSSAHLILLHDILKFNLPDNLAFDAILHLGTLTALLVFFWREVLELLKGFFSSLTNWNLKNDSQQRLAWLIILGSVPAGLLGVLFNDLIDDYFHEGKLAILVIALALIIVGALFWITEKYAKQQEEMKDVTWRQALFCGCAQAIALIPGVSRSGITIIAGMTAKMKREQAARFSFLLSMPVVFGAGMKSLLDFGDSAGADWGVLFIGFLSAAFCGYLAVKYLLQFLGSHRLSVFAWYRVILGAILLMWYFAL